MEIETIHYPYHNNILIFNLQTINITSSMATEAIEVRLQPHFHTNKTNTKKKKKNIYT